MSELWIPRAIYVVESIPMLGTGKADFGAAKLLAESIESNSTTNISAEIHEHTNVDTDGEM